MRNADIIGTLELGSTENAQEVVAGEPEEWSTLQKIRRFFRANTRIKTISSQMKKGADVVYFADLVYFKYKTLLFGCSAARRA